MMMKIAAVFNYGYPYARAAVRWFYYYWQTKLLNLLLYICQIHGFLQRKILRRPESRIQKTSFRFHFIHCNPAGVNTRTCIGNAFYFQKLLNPPIFSKVSE